MKIHFRYAILLGIFCFAAVLFAFSRKDAAKPDPEHNEVIQVSGVVRLVGSMPSPELVITGMEYTWYIEEDEEYKLRDLQQRRVVVEGIETVTALFYANGLPAGDRRTLSEIKVISVQ